LRCQESVEALRSCVAGQLGRSTRQVNSSGAECDVEHPLTPKVFGHLR
jgi:hypothetical protein